MRLKCKQIGQSINQSLFKGKRITQVVRPKAPKRDFRLDASEVEKLGDPEKLTYANIQEIRDCKQRILKK